LTPAGPSDCREDSVKAFQCWFCLRKSGLGGYEGLGSLGFDIEKHERSPVSELVLMMGTIIERERLLFKQFDPDCLIQFLYQITMSSCKECLCLRTAHSLLSLYWLITEPFRNWLTRKIDVFAIFFAAFVRHTDCELAYAQLEGLEENEEESNMLKTHFDTFTDEESAVDRNIAFILHLLNIFVPPVKDPLYVSFMGTVAELLASVQDKQQFDLLGEFSVRIESRDFSVLSNTRDRVLFMKALLRLSDFCFYWCRREVMEKMAGDVVREAFGQDEVDEALVAEFHLEHGRKIVWPWIQIFTNFDPLDELVDNFQRNMSWWEELRHVRTDS
jgi:hypothetical protein